MAYAVIPVQLTLTESTLPSQHLASICISPSLVQTQFAQCLLRGIFLAHSAPAPNVVIRLERQEVILPFGSFSWLEKILGGGVFLRVPPSGVQRNSSFLCDS